MKPIMDSLRRELRGFGFRARLLYSEATCVTVATPGIARKGTMPGRARQQARELWMPNHETRQGRGRFRGGSGGLIEERSDMGRERDVPIKDRDVVGDAQNEARCLGMFRDKERETRVCGHKPGETRMRVLEGRCSCNFRKPARCVLHKQRAGHFPLGRRWAVLSSRARRALSGGGRPPSPVRCAWPPVAR